MFWCWFVGFYVTFVPLYILGLMGMTRRLNYYTNPEWTPYLIISVIGVAIIAAGIGFHFLQIIVSVWQHIKNPKSNADTTGDAWNARTLEWSVSSPPPFYNFAFTPQVKDLDAFWEMKESGASYPKTGFTEIHMPKNTSIGVLVGVISFFFGFGLIWHMFWLAIISLFGDSSQTRLV